MPQRQHLHRQIMMLDEDERDERITQAADEQSVEQFIAKLVRAVRRIEGRNKAP